MAMTIKIRKSKVNNLLAYCKLLPITKLYINALLQFFRTKLLIVFNYGEKVPEVIYVSNWKFELNDPQQNIATQ